MHSAPIQIAPRHRAAPSFRGICASSWLSWACYSLGFALALSPATVSELRWSGPGTLVLLAAIAAFFLAVAAIQRHMRLSLLANRFGTPGELVTTGAFRLTRNPIYVAFLVPLASLAYFSLAAALVAIVFYVTTMTLTVIAREERALAARFGAAYADYARRTPRWIGV